MAEPVASDSVRASFRSAAVIAISATAVFWLIDLALATPYNEFHILARHFSDGAYARLGFNIGMSAAAFAATAVFFLIASSSGWIIRGASFVVFAMIVAGEYSVYGAFRRHTYFNDILLATMTDRRFFVSAAQEYFSWISLVPITAFAVMLLLTRRQKVVGPRVALIGWAMIIVFFALSTYATRNSYAVASFPAGLRTLVSYPVIYYVGTKDGRSQVVYYYADREKVEYKSDARPANNIVLIVDESVRGDHLSVNGYPLPTSIHLAELVRSGKAANWGIASSYATCSDSSNALLLTGVTDLPDTKFDTMMRPTIFAYARAMNYSTHYIDGNSIGIWNGKEKDAPDLGEHLDYDDLLAEAGGKRYDIDAAVARHVASIVNSSSGNFIWVNKFGVHIPYTESYPSDLYKGNAENRTNKYDSSMPNAELIREYDAAITYNSNSFFDALFQNGVPANTVFIYTSDHGQTLRENGATVSHCSDTRLEAMVPLIMIAGPETLERTDTNYKASHANIFATMLDLMNFLQDARTYPRPPSLFETRAEDARPRFYFAGDLHGRGDGQLYPFDQ